eukprot:COSAG04_NODE_4572_length_2009_cov_1.868063_1_plen_21_part_10
MKIDDSFFLKKIKCLVFLPTL